MSTPNTPRETANERRRRLLAQVRGAERSIDESLLEHSTTAQDERRRRVNADIEKFLPGVTEDEQTQSGMYEPDPKYFPLGHSIDISSRDYSETHEPMRRRLRFQHDETLGQDVPEWSDEEEREYRRKQTLAEGAVAEGTGEWARLLTPDQVEEWSGYQPYDYSMSGMTDEEVEQAEEHGLEPVSNQGFWLRGEVGPTYDARHYEVPTTVNVEDGKTNLFQGGVVANVSESQIAPYAIDQRNVNDWAIRHRDEVAATGIEDTEWKQRFENLKQDISNTIVPLKPGLTSNQKNQTIAHIEGQKNTHINRLQWKWDNAQKRFSEEDYTTHSRGSGRRRGSRRTDGPVRRDMRGVAGSFINQNERGAYTSRGSMTHARSGMYSTGRLDTSRLNDNQLPMSTDTDVLFSYSTPIAWQRNNGTVIVPTQRHSSTTNRHQSALRHALHDSGYHSPQELANTMLVKAYHVDRHRQTAGNPVAFKHYMPEHGAYEYVGSEEAAREQARQIADEHYEKVQHRQRVNAEIAGRRPLNSRKPFTRAQQRRLEDAGQLRLPMSPNDESTNRYIMEAPISLGYSAQFRGNTN